MATVTKNAAWVLTDWYGSQYGDHEYPKILIHSPEHLGEVLDEFARKEPRLLNLESSDGLCVGLAVGGSLGVVQLHRVEGQQSLIAATNVLHTNEERCFVGDCAPLTTSRVTCCRSRMSSPLRSRFTKRSNLLSG